MCTVEAGCYPAVSGEFVLRHVGATMGVLPDAVGALRGRGHRMGWSRFLRTREDDGGSVRGGGGGGWGSLFREPEAPSR
jgi:hypothetical protein